MTTTATQDSFLDFLQSEPGLNFEQRPAPGEWSNVGNTIGALALRLNLLSPEQILQIVDLQEIEQDERLFGELAVDLGYLTTAQVDRLLEIQRLHRNLELAEQLVVSGTMDLSTLVGGLDRYLQRKGTEAHD